MGRGPLPMGGGMRANGAVALIRVRLCKKSPRDPQSCFQCVFLSFFFRKGRVGKGLSWARVELGTKSPEKILLHLITPVDFLKFLQKIERLFFLAKPGTFRVFAERSPAFVCRASFADPFKCLRFFLKI